MMLVRVLRRAGPVLVLTLIASILALLLLEFGIRVAAPQPLRRDPQNAHVPFGPFYRPRPGLDIPVVISGHATRWTINSLGLRGRETTVVKPPGVYRIAGIGDSFTFGYTVDAEQVFLRRVEALANTHLPLGPAVRFEAVNFGTGGYGTVAERYRLEHDALRFVPDCVVLAIFIGNDVQDALREELRAADRIPRSPPLTMAFRLRRFIGSQSHLYNLAASRLHHLLVKTRMRRIDDSTMDVLRATAPANVDSGWALVEREVLAMRADCAAASIRFLVLLVPIRHQVDANEWAALLDAYRLRDEEFDIEAPQRRCRSFLAAHDIECVDVLPELRLQPQSCYNTGSDAHWNSAGHERVAALLYDALFGTPTAHPIGR